MDHAQHKPRGLYVPSAERDACGVGLIADLTNEPAHEIIQSALQMLENMEHRGAYGADERTGDGAGILTQIPDIYFRQLLREKDIFLPPQGRYGVAMLFLPRRKAAARDCMDILAAVVADSPFRLVYRRLVPTDATEIGQQARRSEPRIEQLFFIPHDPALADLENQLYFLRKQISRRIRESTADTSDDFYISSLSARTIIYKGQLSAVQLAAYYPDLRDDRYTSAMAIVHSRFSTNTIPKWKLAQPFRCIAHNGEINTIRGNVNWWHARERYLAQHDPLGTPLKQALPVCDQKLSDSGNFDQVIDFMQRTGRSIPRTLMMLIPEAWQKDPLMPDHQRAFYEYQDGIMEPWDGPASICFTDGVRVGATLDRNGLRPSRYLLTSDNRLVLASEAGCLPVAPEKVIQKGRLQPGKMLVADLREHRIITDDEVKERICRRFPYRKWLNRHRNQFAEPASIATEKPLDDSERQKHQIAAGFSREDEELIMQTMCRNGKEPIGSMGADVPLAVLSKIAQHPANYFKQQFAQVTNPAIDPLREDFFMSLATSLGAGSRIAKTDAREARVWRFDAPFLTENQLRQLQQQCAADYSPARLSILFPATGGMEEAIRRISEEAVEKAKNGCRLLILSDTAANKNRAAIPSLLITGAIHQRLIRAGLRREMMIAVVAADIWETQHAATLLSYGADLLCPWLALQTVVVISQKNKIQPKEAIGKYCRALEKGLYKIMSKLGISTLASYKGAQTFEALGIARRVVSLCFRGTVTRIGGMDFPDLEREQLVRHRLAYSNRTEELPDLGNYQWKRRGEYHLFNPQSVHLLQHATRRGSYETYRKFAAEIDELEKNAGTLRSFFRVRPDTEPIPIEHVESKEKIMRRFATGAMSFGSISWEAHTTLARTMNRIGGKSNSGEGGEDPVRYQPATNGDSLRSATKQIASGRFGVTMQYLTEADELQIKIAQGAKPGEGGQLPGHKVNEHIARVRHSTPGVDLISPPPHHDIYSIEDLAQLIFDLKNANPRARISVKLVSKSGVGVIASGVVKARADHILISGSDGGTGASPLSSIRHAGLPWEIGLSETHQTLVRNGLRDRVVLQADGQIRTGRDLAIATMLGAEEWGIATAALVVEGCILMRKCHLNTCPVGIATQKTELRKKFAGKVEHLVRYFEYVAEHLREIMAACGVRTVDELVGRTDLLEITGTDRHWKTKGLDLSPILHRETPWSGTTLYASREQEHNMDDLLDHQLLRFARHALRNGRTYTTEFRVQSTDRATGTLLSHKLVRKYGAAGMPEGSLHFRFRGSAGQSFGAFLASGILLQLEGESNDYFGKGLSGGILSVRPDRQHAFTAAENVLIGNVALYGATSGEAYINGKAGDRFCVRNSGATAVVEGIGDNGCEYMTGGIAVILGPVGRNFAAGMSGGIAFIYDPDRQARRHINGTLVELEIPSPKDLVDLRRLIRNHYSRTGSKQALTILEKWSAGAPPFLKVIPTDYKAILEQKRRKQPVVEKLSS